MHWGQGSGAVGGCCASFPRKRGAWEIHGPFNNTQNYKESTAEGLGMRGDDRNRSLGRMTPHDIWYT